MKRVIFLHFSLIGILLLTTAIALGQAGAICPMRTVSVNKVQGSAYLIEAKKDIPNDRLPEIRLELTPIDDSSRIIPVELDDKGNFEVSGLRKGKYRLRFRFIIEENDVTAPYDTIINVKRSNSKRSGKSIDLALSWLSCFDYSIKIVNK